jgi:hypothetical protein
MCLLISPDQNRNEKDLSHWFGSRKKFTYVYKFLRKTTKLPGNFGQPIVYKSPYFEFFKWNFRKQKIFEIKRPSKPTEYELGSGNICMGLHVCTSLKEARRKKYYNDIIVKFKVLKEDVVAVNNYYNEAVCTRLEFVKVLED